MIQVNKQKTYLLLWMLEMKLRRWMPSLSQRLSLKAETNEKNINEFKYQVILKVSSDASLYEIDVAEKNGIRKSEKKLRSTWKYYCTKT